MRLFLGVDGGQSGTVALIGDETGRVVGIGRGPACRYQGGVEEAVQQAVTAAGAAGHTFEAACFGLSGNAEVAVHALVKSAHFLVTHDAAVALYGALAGQPGVIAIAGTGSIAFGRDASGRPARVGGWGYLFGDEGGAFDLVRAALRAALRYEEGWGPPTTLRELLLHEIKAEAVHELMHRFYRPEYPRERIASFAPLVDQAAAAGDPVAQEILETAAQSLATIVGVVRGQLFEPACDVRVSYAGGVFRSPAVLARFRTLVELEVGNWVAAPLYGPAAGALIEAYRAAGVNAVPKEVPLEKV